MIIICIWNVAVVVVMERFNFEWCYFNLVVNSWQKGGGAIFNTVKTKANPAMKTVYKLVSASVETNLQQRRIDLPLKYFLFRWQAKDHAKMRIKEVKTKLKQRVCLYQSDTDFPREGLCFNVNFTLKRETIFCSPPWRPAVNTVASRYHPPVSTFTSLCPLLTGTVRKRLFWSSASRFQWWIPSRHDLLWWCCQGNWVAPYSGWPQTPQCAPRTSKII